MKSKVPTRKGIYDSLSRFEKMPQSIAPMVYPFMSEPVPIDTLIVRKIFKSYLHTPHRFPPDTVHPAATWFRPSRSMRRRGSGPAAQGHGTGYPSLHRDAPL